MNNILEIDDIKIDLNCTSDEISKQLKVVVSRFNNILCTDRTLNIDISSCNFINICGQLIDIDIINMCLELYHPCTYVSDDNLSISIFKDNIGIWLQIIILGEIGDEQSNKVE